MNKPIVSILGNSVPLLIQPFRKSSEEKTYAEHLRDAGFSVLSGTKQSAILSDIYTYLEDECIRHFPDYVIMHFGIVECTYRARPRWLQNFFSMNAWNNFIINKGYNGPYTRGMKFVAKKVYKIVIERPAFRLGLKWRWMRQGDFRFILRDVSKRLFQDTSVKKIIFMKMLPVAPWVERQAPGTQKSIISYNAILESVSQEYRNILCYDPAVLAPDESQSISLDGIHFTAKGHERLAQELTQLLQGERDDYTGWQKINQYEHLYRLYENWNQRKKPGSS